MAPDERFEIGEPEDDLQLFEEGVHVEEVSSKNETENENENETPQRRRLSDHLTTILAAPVNILVAPVKYLRSASPSRQADNDDDDYANVTQTFGQEHCASVRQAPYEAILAADDYDEEEEEEAQETQPQQQQRVMMGYAAYHGSKLIPAEVKDNWEHFVTNTPTAAPKLSVARPKMYYPGFGY